MLANHRASWAKIDGLAEPVRVEAGQFITGRYEFHKRMYPKKRKTSPDPKTVWRWLQTLESMQNLTIKSTNKYSMITIINWHTYQDRETENVQENVQHVSSTCPARVQHVSTNKNIKNVQNIKNSSTTIGDIGTREAPNPGPIPPSAGSSEVKKPNGWADVPDEVVEPLEAICKRLSKSRPKFPVWKFVGEMVKDWGGQNADIILQALTALDDNPEIASPWGYVQKIFVSQVQNRNEARALEEHEQLKKQQPVLALMSRRDNRMEC